MKLWVILCIAWCFLNILSSTGVHTTRCEDGPDSPDVREVSFRTMKGGEAKATSRYNNNSVASRGFAQPGYTWHTARGAKLPQSIWYEFPGPLKIVKFAFQSRTDVQDSSPNWAPEHGTSRYEFWGSNGADCSDTESQVILVEDNSGTPFSKNNTPKVEDVDTPHSYRCYGFTIKGNPSTNKYFAMSNIRFWYERDNSITTTKPKTRAQISMSIKDGPEVFESAILKSIEAPEPGVCEDHADNCQRYLKVCSHYKVQNICPKTCGACVTEVKSVSCDPPFMRLGKECLYFATETKMNWTEALHFCEKKGSFLAEVNDHKTLMNYVKNVLHLKKVGVAYWLGANDQKKEGKWEWNSGFPIDSSIWGKDQPNNYKGQDCMEIQQKFEFIHDGPCRKQNYPICEKLIYI